MNNEEQKPHREEVCPGKKGKLDLVQVRADIEKKNGPEFWRSLEELAGTTEFQEMMHREFPKGASEWLDAVSRRGFLKLMAASMALAGMTACTKQPLEPIVPYVRQPEEIVPGRPMFFASAFTLGGYGSPVLVESHMYRPTKIEGNNLHPASQGGTDVYAQASVLDMYDPDRSQNVMFMGDISTWGALSAALQGPLNAQKSVNGSGIRILSRSFSSPTLADQMQQVLKLFPQAKWHFYEPVNRDNVYAGAQMAFGQPVETQYKLDAADVIVSLDADFLSAGFPGTTRYARDFAKRRDPDSGKMNRLYVIESTPSPTGAKADHRVPMRAMEVGWFARALAKAIGLKAGMGPVGDDLAEYVPAIIKDLQAHRGSSVVVPGDHQPPEVHALVHALNQTLGNVGQTVFYTDPVLANAASQNDSLKDLVSDMRAGKVDLLIILGGNPAYDALADFGFADALKNSNIPIRIHLGLHNDETAELCQWHVNEAHYLEAWGDTRAFDGTVSIVQPLIAPLYSGKSAHELVALLAGQSSASGHDIVQNYWKTKHTAADFEMWWRKSLHDGWMEESAYAPKHFNSRMPDEESMLATLLVNGTELNFRRDPSIYDGQFSNNAWLQELPKPMSKMTWDNPLLMGPKMAEGMGVKSGDMVLVELNGNSMKLPVWIQAGHPDKSVTVFLGYGRQRAGRSGTGAGFDVYPLRYSATPWFTTTGVKVSKAGGTYVLATTQGYQTMDVGDAERPLIRTKMLEEYKKEANQSFDEEKPQENESLYPPYDYKSQPYSWGMAIDLNSCIGCNNCIIACQSENNIAVVGKEQVNKGRHMHWLRVDAYYQGDRDNPKAYFQPVPCMQCENAPCELVCPVGATTHSTEGLNDMVYNRCVGTRYCSNNCPYKVRRFNFLRFQEFDVPQFKMMHNPDVTVRTRGVMEKCTYCVQRINHARIDSETAAVREGKDIRIKDGELQTACQQSCPANAIAFGNINDPNSLVSKWKAKSRNYGLLDDLNTRPRTTYLAEIRNPNPELEGSSS
jgi:MoCo/4Fe-4S cofactor protein with predicted Tat translocation signal